MQVKFLLLALATRRPAAVANTQLAPLKQYSEHALVAVFWAFELVPAAFCSTQWPAEPTKESNFVDSGDG